MITSSKIIEEKRPEPIIINKPQTVAKKLTKKIKLVEENLEKEIGDELKEGKDILSGKRRTKKTSI